MNTNAVMISRLAVASTLLSCLISTPAIAQLAPTGLTAQVNGSTVTLRWNPNTDGIDAYRIEAGTSPTLFTLATFTVAAPTTSITVNGVPDGTYFVRVRAAFVTAVGAPSNVVTVRIVDGRCVEPPGPPRLLTQSVVSSLVTLTWLPTALGCQPSEYVVTAGSRTGSADLAALVVATNELRVNAPDGDYFVRVVSLNKNGPSAASNEVLVTVRGSEPPGGIDILPESVAVNGASIKGLIKNNSRVRWPTVQVVGTNRRTGITATPFVYGRARRTINGLISLTSLGPGEVACFESIVLPGSVPEEYDFRVITAAPTPLWELSNTVTSSLSIEPVSLQVNISGLNSSISNAIASEVDIAFYSLDATGKTIDCFAARIGSLEPGMSKAVAFPPRLTPIAMVHWPRWIE